MKIKHFAIFNKPYIALDSSDVWDDLRGNSAEPHFYLPTSFGDYKLHHDTAEPSEVAKWVIQEAKKANADTLVSVGCGIAHLEYELKKFSKLKVIITDYGTTIDTLKAFSYFDDAYRLDIFKDELNFSSSTIVLLPRIDTEFTDEQLSIIFEKLALAKVNNICFIPAQLLSIRIVLAEAKMLAKQILMGKKRTFCGFSRSTSLFLKLFSTYYSATFFKLPGKKVFTLTRKNRTS